MNFLRSESNYALTLVSPLPLLYEFCEFFGLQYAIGYSSNSRLQGKAQRLERRLARRYRRTGEPQRSFSSFRYRAHRWSHQRRICYKAEHADAGSNLRFLVTNLPGRSRSVFSFYNDRGECENRIEEFKNGFAADRLSCHRFRANAFRLLLHSFAYNLVNLFRLQLPSSMRSAQIETLRTQLFKIGARIRHDSSLHPHSPGQRLAFSRSLPRRLALQLLLVCLGDSTTHSRKGQAELSRKTVRGGRRSSTADLLAAPANAARSLSCVTNCAFCATILASDELTRLGN